MNSYPSLPLGDYSLGLTDGHGQWFGVRLDRFEPSRTRARSVRPVWCFAGPWFKISYCCAHGVYYVNRKPRIWQRLRWAYWSWRRKTT